MRRPTILPLLFLALCAPFGGAEAQEPYTPLVPGGSVRLRASPIFSAFSSRFGADRRSGTLVEGEETLGSDFTTDAVGVTVLPALAGFQQALADAAQTPLLLNLGSLASVIEKTQVRVPFSLDLGITDWLNVGATVPVVRNDAAIALDFTADSTLVNAGLSPGINDPSATDGFLGNFQTAIDGFQVTQMAECQVDPGSAACLDATSLLNDAQALHGALATMYQAFSLAPFTGSQATAAIEARLGAIAAGFSAAGVVGTPVAIPVASVPLNGEEFQALLTDPRFGTAASFPLRRWLTPWALGDIDFRVMIRLLDVGDEDSSARFTVGAGATYRLGTGTERDPGNVLDLGTGDGQDDIEVRGWINTRWSRRFGVWGDLRYGIQQSGSTERHVFDPDFPLAPASTEATLEWSPGDYQRLEISPWFRIADALTFAPAYRYFRKGDDTFTPGSGGERHPRPDGPHPRIRGRAPGVGRRLRLQLGPVGYPAPLRVPYPVREGPFRKWRPGPQGPVLPGRRAPLHLPVGRVEP